MGCTAVLAAVAITGIQSSFATNCDYALDASATCQSANTGNCPGGCGHGAQTGGTRYSQNTVYTTTAGGSISDGTTNVDCHRPLNCTAGAPIPNKFCGLVTNKCDTFHLVDNCVEYTATLGSWVTSPSAKIKACNEE